MSGIGGTGGITSGAVGTSVERFGCEAERFFDGKRFLGRCATGVPLPMAAMDRVWASACAAASSGVAPATWAAVASIALLASALSLCGRIDNPPFFPPFVPTSGPIGCPSGPIPSDDLRQA